MNQEIKKLWVEDLTSGEYQQTTGRLRYKNEFCCLGVLCDLHRKSFKENEWEEVADEDKSYLGETKVLPLKVVKWAELDDSNPSIESVSLIPIAELNDDSYDFKSLAEIIEKEF